MTLFTRLIEALHRSRRREAELVIRRYSHLVAQVHEHERRRPQAVDVPASPAPKSLAPVTRYAS